MAEGRFASVCSVEEFILEQENRNAAQKTERDERLLLKPIYYSCSCYPTRASHSGQVDGFRNPMTNELKTTACLEIFSNTDGNFLNLHTHRERKIHDDKQVYLITNFTKQTLNKL